MKQSVIAIGEWLTQVAIVVALFSSPTFCGCSGSSQNWEKTHAASGVVTLKGRPISDAQLYFFPQDVQLPETVRPKAQSSEGGKFEVWTYAQGDGAPAGNYKVTVVRNAVVVSQNTIVAKTNDLPGKYSTVDTSDIVVAIAAGQNELPPIDLK